MVPVSDAWKNAIKNKAKQKILLEFPDITLTNDDISMDGGLEYTEVLNGDTDLNMGRAVMSSLSVRLINKGQLPDSIYTSEFKAKIGVDIGGTYEYVSLGKFTPERPQRTKSKYVDLQAYDRMHLFEKDASAFLQGLNLYDEPKTAWEILFLVCDECGVQYTGETFPLRTTKLTFDTFRNKEVNFRDVIAWIAEMACCYARINRDGYLEMVWFAEQDHVIEKSRQFEVVIAERITPVIDKLEVYTSYTDILSEDGDGNNLYQIIDNPFLYAENEGDVDAHSLTLYGYLRRFPAYYPATVRAEADPAVQCGDIIKFVDDDGTEKILPVFAQTLTWNGYAKAVYESTGQPKRSNLPTEQRMLAGLKKEFVRKADLSTTIDSYLSTEEGKAGIISAVEGEFVTADALTGYAKTSEVSATIEQAITAHDATITLTASQSTSATETDVSRYVSVSEAAYGFTLTDDGYYTSTNAGVDNSYSYGMFRFDFDEDTEVTFRCISYGENNFDYGILSIEGKDLNFDNSLDSEYVYHSFKSESSKTPQDIKMIIPAGELRYVTFKYIKDSSMSDGGDYFKIKALVVKPSTSQTSTITLKSGSTVISSADITFNGIVTFESLETAGATIINGANVTTDNLYVETVWATNEYNEHHSILKYYYLDSDNSLRITIGRDDDEIVSTGGYYKNQYMDFYANFVTFYYINNLGTYQSFQIDTESMAIYANGFRIYCRSVAEGYT